MHHAPIHQSNASYTPPAIYWRSVPCDIVAKRHAAACLAEHERAGIEPYGTSAGVAPREDDVPEAGATNYACAPDTSYVPLIDMAGVDERGTRATCATARTMRPPCALRKMPQVERCSER